MDSKKTGYEAPFLFSCIRRHTGRPKVDPTILTSTIVYPELHLRFPTQSSVLARWYTHPMTPLIPTSLRLLPPLQHLSFNFLPHFPHLHSYRPTRTLHIPPAARLMPSPLTQVPPRTRTQRTQQVLLSKEIQIRRLRRRTLLHEIPPLVVEARDLKHVQHVVHVELC
jgi:hypothetical protein